MSCRGQSKPPCATTRMRRLSKCWVGSKARCQSLATKAAAIKSNSIRKAHWSHSIIVALSPPAIAPSHSRDARGVVQASSTSPVFSTTIRSSTLNLLKSSHISHRQTPSWQCRGIPYGAFLHTREALSGALLKPVRRLHSSLAMSLRVSMTSAPQWRSKLMNYRP